MYKKNQHILIIIQNLNPNKSSLHHAVALTKIFKAKILITPSPFSKNKIQQTEIEDYISDTPEARFLKIDQSDLEPNKCIEKLNIIFMLVQVDQKNDFKFFLKNNIFNWVLTAKIPTILIGDKTSNKADYSNIQIPIDHKKESKEKMIWASYFGRFNKAIIHLIPAKEKDSTYMKTIRNTLLFTKKMFTQFNFDYKISKSEVASKQIDEEAFSNPATKASDLVILMTGKVQGVFFLRFNSKKIKHFTNTYPNPILLINPLKDYYLPCEG